jgi:putative ABC transport system permease protein
MNASDTARFAWRSLWGSRGRTLLVILATSIGVAAVVVLTSLGEGARRYVRNQFAALGTNFIVIIPGRAETAGGGMGVLSGRTARDLTLDDALLLLRIRRVESVIPVNLVSGEIWWKGHRRDVPVIGSTAGLMPIWNITMASGRFLPVEDPRRATPVCVIGAKIRSELFGAQSPLGEWVRIADRRFRVIGVLAPKGQFLGVDVDELALIPVTSAQVTFNLPSLLRVIVKTRAAEDVHRVADEIRRVIRSRHNGEEDITVFTEDSLSTAFDKILVALTLAVGAIASISLAVAGILIMNVMLIAVSQRRSEIGLLKALGAAPQQIRVLFFAEAAILSGVGGVTGLVLGSAGSFVIRQIYPSLPAYAPAWASAAGLGIAVGMGIVFTIVPAQRAARLDPSAALARR